MPVETLAFTPFSPSLFAADSRAREWAGSENHRISVRSLLQELTGPGVGFNVFPTRYQLPGHCSTSALSLPDRV